VTTPGESGVTRRFRGEATRWDAIYSEDRGVVASLWDRLTRANVRRRFERTFELAGDLHGKTVLDLGCGSGRYLVEAVARGATRALGVDIAPEMLAVARRLAQAAGGGDRIDLVQGDLMTLELNERFDWVIANGLFDYLEDAERGLARAAEWCRVGVVATFPSRHAPRALPRWLYWRLRGIRIRFHEPREITALAARAGLHDLHIERIGPITLLLGRSSVALPETADPGIMPR
jgi:SAM-dependent methyltransferase